MSMELNSGVVLPCLEIIQFSNHKKTNSLKKKKTIKHSLWWNCQSEMDYSVWNDLFTMGDLTHNWNKGKSSLSGRVGASGLHACIHTERCTNAAVVSRHQSVWSWIYSCQEAAILSAGGAHCCCYYSTSICPSCAVVSANNKPTDFFPSWQGDLNHTVQV